jgi:peptidoglycan/LPS O-acetylase OafA/YrhL
MTGPAASDSEVNDSVKLAPISSPDPLVQIDSPAAGDRSGGVGSLPAQRGAEGRSHRDGDAYRLDFLDGFRGWLSIWVFLGHAASAVMFRVPLLDAPAKAVDLFMIVSGFLMMYHYRQRETGHPWESPATWRSFWLRRYFRIAPVYYLLLTVGIVFGRTFFTLHGEFLRGAGRAHPAGGAAALDAVLHFTFLFGLFPGHCATMPIPDWSIALEMQFYALFPFLALAMRRLGPLTTAMTAALITVISTRFLWQIYDLDHPKLLGAFAQPSLILLKIGLFFVGMIGAEAMALKKRGHPAAAWTGIVAVLLAAVVASKVVAAMAAVLIVLAFSVTGRLPAGEKFFGWLRRFLGSKFSGFLAARSYSLYLSHTLVLFAVGVWLNRWPWFAAASPFPRFAVLSAACAAVLVPVTWLLFVGVEVPGIELGKRWLRARPALNLELHSAAHP